MAAHSRQDRSGQAVSLVNLLWRQHSAPWIPEVIGPEYSGWRWEEAARHSDVRSPTFPVTFLEGLAARGQVLPPVLALAVVDKEPVTVVRGEHPGLARHPARTRDARIRATVHPAPYDDHARTRYRRNA